MSPIEPLTGGLPLPASPAAATAASGPKQPGKDEFLQLLVTQLRHQDPLNPMQDRDFITQLAQFNALEEMQKVSKGIEAFSATQDVMAAAGFLGKTVEFRDPQLGVQSGPVSRVSWETGYPKLTIGEKEVDLAQIIAVH